MPPVAVLNAVPGTEWLYSNWYMSPSPRLSERLRSWGLSRFNLLDVRFGLARSESPWETETTSPFSKNAKGVKGVDEGSSWAKIGAMLIAQAMPRMATQEAGETPREYLDLSPLSQDVVLLMNFILVRSFWVGEEINIQDIRIGLVYVD